MLNNEICAEFEIQPKQNFHYRYASEMGMTHGVLNGQIENSYPKVILNLPENQQNDEFGNKRDFFVLCSLHRYAANKNNIVLSPHLLQQKNNSRSSSTDTVSETDSEPEEKLELNYDFIFEKMQENPQCPTKRYWELEDYVLICLTKKEYRRSIEEKHNSYNKMCLPLSFDRLLGDINLKSEKSLKDSAQLNVCLGVTIFERNFYDNTYSQIGNTIYSCNIINCDDLRIHNICNPKGSSEGGTQVTLLIKLPPKISPQVCIKKIHPITKETEWETSVNVSKTDIFHNHAITFTTPPYIKSDEDNDKNEIEVKISVKIRDTTIKSNQLPFFYVIHEQPGKKRRLHSTISFQRMPKDIVQISDVSKDNVSISKDNVPITMPELDKLHIHDRKVTLQRELDQINDMMANADETELDNSPIFDAMDSNDGLKHLYRLCKRNPKFCKLVTSARNEINRENLLHVVCKKNNPDFIGPLIGMGCSLNAQDILGRTPLHIAISDKHHKVISTILKCLQNLKKYPESVKDNFIKMTQTYDDNGYTVLHAAALQGEIELFENLLKFCVGNQVNILDYGALHTGDSIGHLMVRNDLKSIKPLLEKYVPNYQDIENYAGKTVRDYLLDMQGNQDDLVL